MEIRVIETALDGVVIVEPEFVEDERGFFVETYHKRRFAEHGLTSEFVQDNHSRSRHGVLRGLHYQGFPIPQDKLVRCTLGSILDVAVDLRVGSPTFGKWVAVELTAANKRQLMIPVGFGHGFLTLSEVAEVQYRCTDYYAPATEGGVIWNDPDLAIEWPMDEPVLSARDRVAPSLRDYLKRPAFVYRGPKMPPTP